MEHLGKQIRTFRLHRDLTQERLADALGVTAQAVSKWENGASCPDISLLPELSAVLGVTLDELFDTDGETHLRRIEAMIEDGAALSEEDFRYAERQLQDGCGQEKTRARCLTMLADLYCARAEYYHDLAAGRAKEALEIEPDNKSNHASLARAAHGAIPDWCTANHTALIDYYRDFTARHPNYAPGYLWYMDNLIGDGRLDEARSALEKMRAVRDSYHVELYEGIIAEAAGARAAAERCWDAMVEKYPDTWETWFSRGDAYAKRADYQRAVADYRAAAERQTRPRYTDAFDSIAQLCALCGDRAGAVEAYRRVVDILREDWGLTEGETVGGYLENIRQLS